MSSNAIHRWTASPSPRLSSRSRGDFYLSHHQVVLYTVAPLAPLACAREPCLNRNSTLAHGSRSGSTSGSRRVISAVVRLIGWLSAIGCARVGEDYQASLPQLLVPSLSSPADLMASSHHCAHRPPVSATHSYSVPVPTAIPGAAAATTAAPVSSTTHHSSSLHSVLPQQPPLLQVRRPRSRHRRRASANDVAVPPVREEPTPTLTPKQGAPMCGCGKLAVWQRSRWFCYQEEPLGCGFEQRVPPVPWSPLCYCGNRAVWEHRSGRFVRTAGFESFI